jgi:hypothetical protein
MLKELLEQLGKMADILNVGRLIFYTFAGVLIVVPLHMNGRLLAEPKPDQSVFIQMACDFNVSGLLSVNIVVLSLVVGFVVAPAAFGIVIERLGKDLREEIEQVPINENSSFSYNYPLLKKEQDYAAWLISEYYRYVEIATFIPLGFVIGLLLIGFYVFIYLMKDFTRTGVGGFTEAHGAFLGIIGILLIIKVYVWPTIWEERVVKPAMRAYLLAKRNVIKSLHVKQAQTIPSGER